MNGEIVQGTGARWNWKFLVLALLVPVSLACSPNDRESPTPPPTQRSVEEDADLGDQPELSVAMEEQLRALGYVASDAAHDESGVVLHDASRAHPGLNLYLSQHGREARLIDMEGKTVHVWRHPAFGTGEMRPTLFGEPTPWLWRTAHLFSDGSLLTQTDYGPLVKLDRDSRILWSLDERTHHDFDVREDGHIFVLVYENRRHPRFGTTIEDVIVEVDSEGKELRRVSILDALVRGDEKASLELLDEHQRSTEGMIRMDLTHTNSLELLDGSLASKLTAFRRGSLLLSLRTINRLIVIDVDAGKAVWGLSGEFRDQHHPTMLESGNLLLFDNAGLGDVSRALELELPGGRTVWSYGETGADAFYSKCCGRVHRMPNGNTLIIASNPGRAIEVTPDGVAVWEFRNPHQLDGKVSILSDVMRISRASLPWLEQ